MAMKLPPPLAHRLRRLTPNVWPGVFARLRFDFLCSSFAALFALYTIIRMIFIWGGRASPVNALGHGKLRGGWRLVLPPWTAGAPLKRETCVQTTGAPIRRETCVLGLRLVLP